RDGLSSMVIEGAVFELYLEDDTLLQDNIISTKGVGISIKGLKVGKYYLKEVKAPQGYLLNKEKISFEIKDQAGTTLNVLNYASPSINPVPPVDPTSNPTITTNPVSSAVITQSGLSSTLLLSSLIIIASSLIILEIRKQIIK
ncbi:MAG: prealbumin-like fold domain-containing protein, partial [Bacilli bacterium]